MKRILLTIGILIVAVAIIFTGVMLVQAKTYTPKNPIATIQIEGYDKAIRIELDPQSAPNAVANFVKLANNGFYTDFKMSIKENRILGDESMEKAKLSNIMEYPQSDYTYGIKGDFIANDYDKNLLKHKKGVITMERDDYSYLGYTEEGYNSANCNFAILTEDIDSYNGNYAAFGKVIEGIDVLDAISATRVEESEDDKEENNNTENKEDENTESEKTKNTIIIKSISVDTFGIDYGMPETVNYEEISEKVDKIYDEYFNGDKSQITTLDDSGIVQNDEGEDVTEDKEDTENGNNEDEVKPENENNND